MSNSENILAAEAAQKENTRAQEIGEEELEQVTGGVGGANPNAAGNPMIPADTFFGTSETDDLAARGKARAL